jgi:Protein of unknown function (DUF1453)
VPSQYGPLLPYLLPLLFLMLIVRRGMTARKIKIERMWVMPALLILAGASLFTAAQVPSPLIMAELAAALAGGGVVGWYRGRLTHITIDPATHDLTSRTSPVGVVLIAVLFAARYGIRVAFPSAGYEHPGSLGSQAGAIADALALFGIGAMVVQRLEMWLRCRRLLAEAQGAGTGVKLG